MPIKNNYWTVLSKTPRHYTAWPGGWEIHVRVETYPKYASHNDRNKPTDIYGCLLDKNGNPRMENQICYDKPKGMPMETRADFKRQLNRDKRIAQATTNREEYNALWRRIDDENWDFIEANDLKDEGLKNWAYNTRTAHEYDMLLRYN
jgi:hypothetical protein